MPKMMAKPILNGYFSVKLFAVACLWTVKPGASKAERDRMADRETAIAQFKRRISRSRREHSFQSTREPKAKIHVLA